HAPPRHEPVQLGADRLNGARGPLGIDVGEDDGDTESPHEERREPRRHPPGADDPHALDAPWLGPTGRRLPREAPLDDVERVERRLRLGPGEQLGGGILLRAGSLLEAPPRPPFDQLKRPVGRGRLAVHRVVDPCAGAPPPPPPAPAAAGARARALSLPPP